MKLIKLKTLAILAPLILIFTQSPSFCQEKKAEFSRKVFYSAMASRDIGEVDEQLKLIKQAGRTEKIPYEGALLMKKAGLVQGAPRKLQLFKDGHKKLEGAIAKDSTNAEWRFLRLMIQEKAPGILGYKNDLHRDSAYIRQSFKKLSADIRMAIIDYSKTSKVLRTEDF